MLAISFLTILGEYMIIDDPKCPDCGSHWIPREGANYEETYI
jgi:hypothetical protein